MPFRFRKSFRLFPGVRLNLSKSGMSVSLGAPGATLNLSARGAAITLGIPGSGLSFRHQLSRPTGGRERAPPILPHAPPSPQSAVPPPAFERGAPLPGTVTGEIRSGEIATLTTPDLAGLKRLIVEAAAQRQALRPDLRAGLAARRSAWKALRRRERSLFRNMLAGSIARKREAFAAAELEALKVASAYEASHIRITINLAQAARAAYRDLVAAHDRLARCAKVWDVTTAVFVDRYRTRSAAGIAITRTPVRLGPVTDEMVSGNFAGLRFGNANGGDLDVFPCMILMRARRGGDFALVDLRDLRLEMEGVRFVESETVPHDTEIVGQAWERSNKDGSRDRRFAQNRQIPVALYGELRFSTPQGLHEAYQFSDCDAALAFARAFDQLRSALHRQVAEGAPAPPEDIPPAQAVPLPPLPDVWTTPELIVATIALALGSAGALAAYPPEPLRLAVQNALGVVVQEPGPLPSAGNVAPPSASDPRPVTAPSPTARTPGQPPTGREGGTAAVATPNSPTPAARSSEPSRAAGQRPGEGTVPPEYLALVRTELTRLRTYPPQALAQGQEGVVTVRLTIGVQGRVTSHTIVSSSGVRILDDAVRAMMGRVRLPPPPGGPITVSAPIRFALN